MTSLSEIDSFVSEQLQLNEDGYLNQLQAYIEAKKALEVLTNFVKTIQDQAFDEATKYGEKSFGAFGAKIEIRATAGQWKYDHLPEVISQKNKLKELEERAKEAFKLKQKGGNLVTDDGQVVEPAHYQEGKDTIFISFKKT